MEIKWEKEYKSYKEVEKENLPEWFKEYTKYIGEKFIDALNKEVTLIGMSQTNEDLYYIVMDSNKIYYESCVGKLKKL